MSSHVTAIFVLSAIALPVLSAPYAQRQPGASWFQTAATQCPCTFFFTAAKSAPNFDVLTIHSNRFHQLDRRFDNSIPISYDAALSHLNQSHDNAAYRGAHQSIHRIHLPVHGVFKLVLRAATPSTDVLSHTVKIRGIDVATVHQRSTCPVQLPQHQPRTRRFSSTESPSSPSARIVGGLPGNRDLAKYVVLFETAVNETTVGYCSGTLVSPTIVITAAHCRLDLPTIAHVGRRDGRPSSDGTAIPVADFERHPLYDPFVRIERSSRYDIALVTLAFPAPKSAKFMKVNVNQSIPIPRSVARTAGYGQTIANNRGISSNPERALYQVDSPIVSNNLCLERYGPTDDAEIGFSPERQVCTGHLRRGGCSACSGDSGGPLFQYDENDDPVLVGLVSAGGRMCAAALFPTIHVRTSAYSDFLPDDGVIQRTQSTVAVLSEEEEVGFGKEAPRFSTLTLVLLAGVGATAFLIVLIAVGTMALRWRQSEPATDARDDSYVVRGVQPDMQHAYSSGEQYPSTMTLQPPPPVASAMYDSTEFADGATPAAAATAVAAASPEQHIDWRESQGQDTGRVTRQSDTEANGNVVNTYDPYEGLRRGPSAG